MQPHRSSAAGGPGGPSAAALHPRGSSAAAGGVSRPFGAVLVANRGEIAVRIIRTLRRLGIRSVAVHSDADAGAPHVALADAAVRIGPAPAAESYLRVDAIVEAALRSGAEAVHPGYGFLSENPALARACAEADLVFVGPSAEAIAAMGDKIGAKELVAARGVPVVPGRSGVGLGDEELATAALELGFPLLVKPAAGGGGKGMQVVHGAGELAAALASARRVARAAFGDDTLLLERLIPAPRHIEVQVLADRHGGVVHLGERECSLQRRHQKVVEEAPSPFLGAAARERMGAAACEVARAAGYEGAGTIEFLVPGADPDEFFFIEMNARLQVEHPVTEQVTGLDLVELQLRIAAGEPLPFGQDDVRLTGHAIEARIYAESPERGFLPQAGAVLAVREPTGEGIRVDSGIAEGLRVTGDYDPTLAKVIATGADRAEALARLDAALAGTCVLGVETNTAWLRSLLRDPAVAAGQLDTGLIDRRDAPGAAEPEDADLVAAALALHAGVVADGGAGPWARDGWRSHGRRGAARYSIAGREVRVVGAPDAATARIGDGRPVGASLAPPSGPDRRLAIDRAVEPVVVAIERTAPGTRTVWLHRVGRTLALDAPGREERVARAIAAIERADRPGSPELRARMPGTVAHVAVADGDRVEAGQLVLSIEAMKMEHPLTAPVAGVVRVPVRPGDQVRLGQVVAVVEAEEAG